MRQHYEKEIANYCSNCIKKKKRHSLLNFGEMSRRIWARLKGLFIHGRIFEEQDKRESAVMQSDADKPEGVRAWGEDPAAGLPGSLRRHDRALACYAHPRHCKLHAQVLYQLGDERAWPLYYMSKTSYFSSGKKM